MHPAFFLTPNQLCKQQLPQAPTELAAGFRDHARSPERVAHLGLTDCRASMLKIEMLLRTQPGAFSSTGLPRQLHTKLAREDASIRNTDSESEQSMDPCKVPNHTRLYFVHVSSQNTSDLRRDASAAFYSCFKILPVGVHVGLCTGPNEAPQTLNLPNTAQPRHDGFSRWRVERPPGRK